VKTWMARWRAYREQRRHRLLMVRLVVSDDVLTRYLIQTQQNDRSDGEDRT
jgi:hypothetical protein